jgi:hypothetical protein
MISFVTIREMTRYSKAMMVILACRLVTREYLSFTMTHPMMSTTLNFSIRDGYDGVKREESKGQYLMNATKYQGDLHTGEKLSCTGESSYRIAGFRSLDFNCKKVPISLSSK